MNMTKKVVNLIFPKKLMKEPVIYNLGHRFKIITNLIKADMSRDEAWVLLELEGTNEEIDKGINWIKSLGIKVAPPGMEDN